MCGRWDLLEKPNSAGAARVCVVTRVLPDVYVWKVGGGRIDQKTGCFIAKAAYNQK